MAYERVAAVVVGLAAAAGVAYALARSARTGPADGINWTSLPADVIDAAEGAIDLATEAPAEVPGMTAEANIEAFLATLKVAEGTARAPDPYRVVMGYGHTIEDLSDHPYFTGEWKGAAFGNGQWSTAAGAYQIIRATWADSKRRLDLPDFGPHSQDLAAIELIRQRGALEDVKAGRFAAAVGKVRRIWASLPGAGYGQGERSLEWLAAQYSTAGGTLA